MAINDRGCTGNTWSHTQHAPLLQGVQSHIPRIVANSHSRTSAVGADHHRAELIEPKEPPVLADASSSVQDRSAIVRLDSNTDREEQRRQQHESHCCCSYVEQPCQHRVNACSKIVHGSSLNGVLHTIQPYD